MSPAVLSVGRFAIALVVLIPLAARRPGFMRTLRRPRTVLLGLTGVTLYYSFANIGLLFTTPGTAALTAAFLPVLTAAAAVAMIHERLTGRTWLGLALATIGVALVAASGFRVDVGVLLNIVALASYAIYTVLLRRDAGRARLPDAIVLATATGIWGTLILLPWLLWEAVAGTIAASCRSGRSHQHPDPRARRDRPDPRPVQLRGRTTAGRRVRGRHGRDPRARIRVRAAAR